MRKTWKRVLALVLAVLMLGTLAACKDGKNDGPTAEQVRNTNAVTVGNHTLSAVEVNYFYIDAISNFCNQYGSYISYFLSTTTPLSQQKVSEETGQTWADAFLEMAWENIRSTYALCDLAEKENFTLTAAQKESLAEMAKSIREYAATEGYESADDYVAELYGVGASVESYCAYYEVNMLANAYYAHYANSLTYEDEALRAYEADKMANYSSYHYTTYYLSAVKFRKGGTEDEKGNVTYSEEEKAQAILECKLVAEALAAGTYENKDALDEAIKALEINANLTKPTLSKSYTDVLYSSLDSLFSEWLTSADRVKGDITVIEKSTGTDEKKVVDGYYVVVFDGINDNTFALKNVRHILVKFQGGKTDSTTGVTTYTAEEKAAAKAEAEKLLAQWEAGEKTEESFGDLAALHTDDGNGDVGGLYENVYPGQMVEPFENWCYDSERKPGNYGLVETSFGWHIMFFSGDSDMTFRDFMISNEMAEKDLKEWYKALVDATVLTELDLTYVDKDMTLSG